MSAAELDLRFAPAAAIADAVLNEGRVLYPYRASAVKNRLRWQWGVLVPRAHAEATGDGDWFIRTECVFEGGPDALVHARVRWFEVAADGSFDAVLSRTADVPGVRVGGAAQETVGPRGVVVRAEARELPGPWALSVVSVEVGNTGSWCAPGASWQEVTRQSAVAVHVLLAVDGGRFVSATDPPAFARPAVEACRNHGSWPVLVDAAASLVLAAPIILPDHPEVAPESPGDFCDATEIDELLVLRILTLTDEEKAEARRTDPLAAEIIDRCEALSPEVLARLHGAIRSLRPLRDDTAPPPWWDPGADLSVDPANDAVQVGQAQVRRGSRVRLRPAGRADALDMFVEGRTATVEAVFSDVDGDHHVAVVIDDDPAADLARAEGRYLYFRPYELEPVEEDL